MRIYVLYGRNRHGPFTVYTRAYGRGTHPWVIEVYATSVRQAYRLAAHGIWACDARAAGMRTVHLPGRAEPERAPYRQAVGDA